MAYQFYQNSKLVQNQLEQNEDSINQSIQNGINEYKQNFAQANYDYAVNLAQEQAGKSIEKIMGETELLGGIPATFNALKKGIPSAKNLISKIKGEPTPDEEPSLTDDDATLLQEPLPEGTPVERSVDFDNPLFNPSELDDPASLDPVSASKSLGGTDVGAEGEGTELKTISGGEDLAENTASDIINSSVQETANVVEKSASKSIWSEIGDVFGDIGLGVADVLDPVADIVEAGVAVAGVGLGAKSIAEAEKKTDIAPPVQQEQSLLQTSTISDVSQPGI